MIIGALDNFINNFSIENLQKFFIQKINRFRIDDEDYDYLFDDDITDNYTDIVKVGEADLDNSEDILVIAVKTLSQLTSRTGKKRQYEIAKKILKEEVKDAAIFVFYDDNGNFRFSLIRSDYLGVRREFTTFKRYTFFVSPEQTNRTFRDQISSADFNSLDNIQEAFSVEPLNKEFYHKVTDAFYNLIGGRVANNEYEAILELPSISVQQSRKIYQEFAVRLIGRTIFVWFLKNKTSKNGIPLIPKDWLTSIKVKETPNYYHTYLEKLFFEILNKPTKERIDDLPEGHSIIPFLNGGLFEPHVNDFYELGYGGYSKYLNTLKIPDSWFEYLFETLERFNFTIDENSIDDQEVSIDPEMLGTIFENLLAEIDPETEESARKSTGSFYTPREIVDFMVTESLVTYLQTKTGLEDSELRHLFAENSYQISDPATKDKLLDAFDEIKIIDPACGSGAFPMGVLHKINSALQKLDPDANNWKEKQLSKIENIAYRKALKEKLDKSNVDYIRKLGIIQHSIYGVDIQSIATEISKLRSFLSLIVDENIDDDADNRGIYPLPNLEFKFVTANTLIRLKGNVTEGNNEIATGMLDFNNINYDISQLQKIRDSYLQSFGEEKEELKKNFLDLQKQIAQKEYRSTSHISKRAQQIIGWNPFNYEKSDWFDPKWMFGVDGFDIVIGNPPYIQLQKAFDDTRKYADLYEDLNYKTFERTSDIYALFYERGIEILKENGLLVYITSNKWMRAKYGKSLRKFFTEYNPRILIDLGAGVFNTATVDTNILLIEKKKVKEYGLNTITLKDKKRIGYLTPNDYTLLTNLSEDSWIILSPEEQKIKEKIEQVGVPLEDWDISIYRGILTGYNDAFIIDGKTKDELIRKDPKSAEIIKPILRGRDIKRYKAEFADLWLINSHNGYKNSKGKVVPSIDIKNYPAIKKHLDQYWDRIKKRQDKGKTPYNLRNCAYAEEFEKEKIIYPNMTKYLPFVYDEKGFYTNQKCYILTGKGLKFLTCYLNSKVSHFYLKRSFPELQGGTRELNKVYFVNVPVPEINRQVQDKVEKLLSIIIAKKEQSEDTFSEEKEIDLMVYKLYELTYDEVKVVDPEFELSKGEYDSYQINEQ